MMSAPKASRILLRQLPGLAAELARVRLALATGTPCLPWKLEFFTTYSCGSRCRTCLIWTRYTRDPELAARELSPEAFARVAASVAEHLLWVSYTGGELTDREDASELVVRVAEAAPRARVLSASSHGLDPDRVEAVFGELARRFPDRAVMVTLSMDGDRPTYEKIRGVDGVEAVHESMARLQALTRWLPNLTSSYQTTISATNLPLAVELLRDLNRRATGNVVTVANDSRVLTEGRIASVDVRDQEALGLVLDQVERETPLSSISALTGRAFLRVASANLRKNEAPIPCTAGLAALSISPLGDVLQCDRHDEPLGTLSAPEYDLRALIKDASYREKLQPRIGCRECFTPCQAYPSMMQQPLRSAWHAASGRWRTRAH